MANIGGNITGIVQTKTKSGKNDIGEMVHTWENKVSLPGWLGLQSGDSKYTNYSAKIEESTHVFLCDYNSDVYALSNSTEDKRMLLKGIVYDILLIDNPDEMDEQLEIYLKRVGAWNGNQIS
jgi:head-tail adaptor